MSNTAMQPGCISVLLIEDNPGDARLIRELLAESGGGYFLLEHAPRLSTGLERLDSGDIAAVLLDLSLPDSQGLQTVARVNEHAPRVPVLVMTGTDDETVTSAAMQQGAQDYLVKGRIDGELLVRSIRYAVDRSRAQLALRESEETFRRMFERNPLPMWVYDRETLHFLEVNKAALEHYGYSREEFLAMSVVEILPPEDAARFQDSSTTPAPDTQQAANWRHRTKDGALIEVECVSDALAFAARRAMLVVVQDITERRRTEEALLAKQAAEKANLAKSEFLSRMSHELRTPLNAILGFTQLLRLDKLTHDQHDSVNQVLGAGRHLLNLINEVLEIARIEAGHMTLSLEPVCVAEVLDECLALINPLADEHSIALLLHQDGTWDKHILGDRQRLKQILLNLLSNAVKYNRPNGSVTVSCELNSVDRTHTGATVVRRRMVDDAPSWAPTAAALYDGDAGPSATGDTIRIVVYDTGPGIERNKLARLFTPFDRLDAEGRGVDGTGLGLALSKPLAMAMNGAIGVESTVGVGTAFWLEMPAATGPDEMRADESESQFSLPPLTRQTRTILYIEDNLSNFKLVDRLLQRWPSIKLIPAMQGSLGLQLAQQHQPDLILLDLHLPDLPGSEVLRRLQAGRETSSIPVIVISADATQQQINRLLAGGARSYLTKPLDVAQFVQVVGETLS